MVDPSDEHTGHESSLTKRKPGTKKKPKPSHVTSQFIKPIYIEVPDNFDVIKAILQFTRCHKVINIIVQSASGTLSSVTLYHANSNASAFTLYGPFSLISLTGTYTNNTAFSGSSSSSLFNHNPYCFRISFSTISGQSIIGVVGGKVVAENGVIVVATIFNNPEVLKGRINNNSEEWNDDDNNNPNKYDQGCNQNMSRLNVATSYPEM